jgi:hypothetical protein
MKACGEGGERWGGGGGGFLSVEGIIRTGGQSKSARWQQNGRVNGDRVKK